MELLILILLGGVFFLWISNQTLKHRLDRIEQRLGALDGGAARPAPETDWAAEPAPATNAPAAEPEPRPAPEPVPAATYAIGYTRVPERVEETARAARTRGSAVDDACSGGGEEQEPETLGGLFERLRRRRLLIWLGGVALVFAAVFLIRYSIEIGLVTPQLRMIAAAVFGFVLLGSGEYARRRTAGRDDPRIAQALVGAGIAVLYADHLRQPHPLRPDRHRRPPAR